mgnify:FL=1
MNCFYLRERLKRHPNCTIEIHDRKNTVVDFVSCNYFLGEKSRENLFFRLVWSRESGTITELNSTGERIYIGTPIVSVLNEMNETVESIKIKPFLSGGFYEIDWQGGE